MAERTFFLGYNNDWRHGLEPSTFCERIQRESINGDNSDPSLLLWVFSRISQKERLQRPPKIRMTCMKKQLLPSSHAWWFSIQIFVNFDFLNCHLSFLYAFKVLNCLLCIKRRFEPHNALGNILRQFENFQINKGLYGKLLKRDWVVRVVFPYKSF